MIRMTRLKCCVCGRALSLYTDYARRELHDLCYSERLADYVHPICIESSLVSLRIDPQPYMRLLGEIE